MIRFQSPVRLRTSSLPACFDSPDATVPTSRDTNRRGGYDTSSVNFPSRGILDRQCARARAAASAWEEERRLFEKPVQTVQFPARVSRAVHRDENAIIVKGFTTLLDATSARHFSRMPSLGEFEVPFRARRRARKPRKQPTTEQQSAPSTSVSAFSFGFSGREEDSRTHAGTDSPSPSSAATALFNRHLMPLMSRFSPSPVQGNCLAVYCLLPGEI